MTDSFIYSFICSPQILQEVTPPWMWLLSQQCKKHDATMQLSTNNAIVNQQCNCQPTQKYDLNVKFQRKS
jgi:hypothetical protein